MKLVSRRQALAALVRRWSARGLTVGFVPTMGALHRGHAALVERARRENDRVVVSVFINPAQFGPNEDYGRYPRALPADAALCRKAGADALYHPSVSEVYPDGFSTFVEPGPLAEPLDGKFRPGHFRGVATVVAKLLNSVRPTRAYFGEKDFQQLAIVRRLAADLDLGVEIVGCPTVREADGLALSSRNAYLSPQERAAAPRLYAALLAGRAQSRRGAAAVARAALAALKKALPRAKVDYVSVVDAATLRPPKRGERRLRLLAAVRLGKTRLIDNIPVSL